MVKNKSIHTYKSVVNKLKRFQNEGETYSQAIERLLDLVDEGKRIVSYEEEFKISYFDTERRFKVKFNDAGFDEIFFYDNNISEYSTNMNVWVGFEDVNQIRYVIEFMREFILDERNFILLQMMGNLVEFNSIRIERLVG